MTVQQISVNASLGLVGSIINFAFGGWSEALTFLLVVITFDYITGIAASIKNGEGLNSQVGFWGLCKKVLMIMIIVVLHRADILMGIEDGALSLMIGGIYFFIVNELISIAENWGRLNLPLPPQIKKIIAVLKEKEGKEQKNESI